MANFTFPPACSPSHLMQNCSDLCETTASACEDCVRFFPEKPDGTLFLPCICKIKDCVDICRATAKILSLSNELSEDAKTAIKAYETFTASSATECRKHQQSVAQCGQCASSCEACHEMCKQLSEGIASSAHPSEPTLSCLDPFLSKRFNRSCPGTCVQAYEQFSIPKDCVTFLN